MKNILWIVTTTKDAPLTAQHAFHQAQIRDAHLTALFVLDPQFERQIFKKFEQENFLGGAGQSRELAESLVHNYEERSKRKFSDIEMQSAGKNVIVKTLLKKGNIAQECITVIRDLKPEEIIFTKMQGSQFSRFFFSTASDKIKTAAACPVTVIEEKEA